MLLMQPLPLYIYIKKLTPHNLKSTVLPLQVYALQHLPEIQTYVALL